MAMASEKSPLIERRKAVDMAELGSADTNESKEGKSVSINSQSGSKSAKNLHSPDDSSREQQIQEDIYKNAAVYASEGEKDAKIFHHPEGYCTRTAYQTLHHPVYCSVHLILSVLLMLLAIPESLLSQKGIHSTHQANLVLLILSAVEIMFLVFFFLDMLIRFIWFGPKGFVTHRTIFLAIFVLLMFLEAVTLLIRQENHFRITRALRPILFIDSHYLYGARRVLRQIFLCIKPITDILLLILFSVVFFSLLGYYLFCEVDPTFFSSFWKAFVSLFITMTTANNPDVMLEAYFEYPYSALFFIAYLAITYYCLMNVLLAVVYGTFEEEEKKKFKQLFKHKLGALDKAYDALSTSSDCGINFYHFLIFMHFYKPYIPEWQVMCIFKALHKQDLQQSCLTKKEFRRLYEVQNLRWKPDQTMCTSTSQFQLQCLVKIHTYCESLVKSKAFNVSTSLIVLMNLFFLIIYTIVTSGSAQGRYEKLHKVLPVSYTFISIYIIEIILRVIGHGPYEYFRKKRNIVDFGIILISFIFLVLETEVSQLIYLAAVRPFKLIRVLRLKRMFSDISTAATRLLRKLIDVAILMVVVYYSFAIIGIECLNGRVYKGCCNNSWFEIRSSYSGIYDLNTTDNIPPSSDVYYLLNFNNILTSYVTLFVLTVVNNWYIIMEGFASEVRASWLVRVYFISFFVVTLVILQVVISYIVDEFKFIVLDAAKKRTCPEHDKPFEHCRCKASQQEVVKITLQPEDIEELKNLRTPSGYELSYFMRKFRNLKFHAYDDMLRHTKTCINFVGRRLRTKDDAKLRLFKAETLEWTSEYEDACTKENKTDTAATEVQKMKLERAKNIVREVCLYFIDWVIE